jgi:hypothetical protein
MRRQRALKSCSYWHHVGGFALPACAHHGTPVISDFVRPMTTANSGTLAITIPLYAFAQG